MCPQANTELCALAPSMGMRDGWVSEGDVEAANLDEGTIQP